MKKYIILSMAILTIACRKESQKNIDYPADKIIEYSELFGQTEFEYYVYVFSHTCLHCIEIEKDIINFYNNTTKSMYFIQFQGQIALNKDIDLTIGCNNIADFSILGTPSLVFIRNKSVINNLGGKKAILSHINNH